MSRDFDAWLREQQGDDITFTLGGREFHVRVPLPAAAPLALLGSNPDRDLNVLDWRNYVAALIREDDDALNEAIVESGMHTAGLREIAQWIVEEATGRPTKRSSPSRRPQSTGGRSTSRGSRKPGSTRAPRLSVAS